VNKNFIKVKNDIQELYFLKNYDTAMDIISTAEIEFPQDPDILFFKGLIQKETNLFDNAIISFQNAIKISNSKVHKQLLLSLAECYLNVNLFDNSIKIYKNLLDFEPDNFYALEGMGKVHLLTNNPKMALSFFMKVFKLKPKHFDSYFNIASSFFLIRDFNKALEAYLNFINYSNLDILPDNKLIKIYNNISICYRNIKSYPESINFLKKSLLLDSNNHYTLFNLGLTYSDTQEFNVAENYLKKAYSLSENNPLYSYNYCNILLMRGEKTLVKSLINKSIIQNPSFIQFLNFSSKIDCNRGDVFFNWIVSLLNNPDTSDAIKVKCEFAMFSILDKAGEYDDAFIHLKVGNDLFNSTLVSSINKSKIQHSLVKDLNFNANYIPLKFENYPIPIFIVGMPRSGTTLTEQILDSHDLVSGKGELTFLSDIISDYNILDNKIITNQTLDLISKRYFKHIKDINNMNHSYLIDKMPGNYFWIKIILKAIPNAKIIHCTRHPMDTCLSIYSKNFSSNFKNYYNLNDIAQSYINYYNLMKNFRISLEDNFFLDFSYEQLIKNPEEKVKELLHFCGLDFDKKCLKFYNNSRFIRTASSVQVRENFYPNSINRWKNYEDQLLPLFKILKEADIFL